MGSYLRRSRVPGGWFGTSGLHGTKDSNGQPYALLRDHAVLPHSAILSLSGISASELLHILSVVVSNPS